MDYSHDFPAQSRAKVEVSIIKARRKFDSACRRLDSALELEKAFWSYVLTPFLVFAEEACRLQLWPLDKVKERCLEALRQLTISAYYDRGRGIIRDPTSHWNGSLLSEGKREIESKPQWRKYENLLLRLANHQTHDTTEVNRLRTEIKQTRPSLAQNSDKTAKITESKPAKAADENTREAFLRPILTERGFSVHDWAKAANVDFHTANDYLTGKTKNHTRAHSRNWRMRWASK